MKRTFRESRMHWGARLRACREQVIEETRTASDVYAEKARADAEWRATNHFVAAKLFAETAGLTGEECGEGMFRLTFGERTFYYYPSSRRWRHAGHGQPLHKVKRHDDFLNKVVLAPALVDSEVVP